MEGLDAVGDAVLLQGPRQKALYSGGVFASQHRAALLTSSVRDMRHESTLLCSQSGSLSHGVHDG